MEQELIKYIVCSLVTKPEAVKTSIVDGDSSSIIELRVAEGDEGRIIGKNGSIAIAMRVILQAACSKTGKRMALEILG
ncbi:MAG: KH domain-containing protein [Termitinemataceae bacterium]|nr:MAG: KH domain-containing protein [Termitinemataceae bacterium]